MHHGSPNRCIRRRSLVLASALAFRVTSPNGLRQADLEWAITQIAQRSPLQAAALTAYDPGSDAEGTGGETALALALALVEAVARRRD